MIITHKLMAAKMFSYLDAWNLNPCSKWLNKVSNDAHMIMELNLVREQGSSASLSFELEVFFPLCFGGSVVVLTCDDPEMVNEAIVKTHITHVTFSNTVLMQSLQCRPVCTAMHTFCDCILFGRNHCLREAKGLQHVVQCGEKLSAECMEMFAATVSACLWACHTAAESVCTLWRVPQSGTEIYTGNNMCAGTPMLYCDFHLMQFNSTELVADGELG